MTYQIRDVYHAFSTQHGQDGIIEAVAKLDFAKSATSADKERVAITLFALATYAENSFKNLNPRFLLKVLAALDDKLQGSPDANATLNEILAITPPGQNTSLLSTITNSKNRILINALLGMGVTLPSLSLDADFISDAIRGKNWNALRLLLQQGVPVKGAVIPSDLNDDELKLVINIVLEVANGDPSLATLEGTNLIHLCERNITKTMLNEGSPEELLNWQNLKDSLTTRYRSIHNKEPEVDFSQSSLVPKIKLYVKMYNKQHPESPIELPVVSEIGWCAGFSSVWGYLKAGYGKEGDAPGQIDETWFFKQLDEIATTSAKELASKSSIERFAIEKLIGYINLLQGKGEVREKYLFDSAQVELNKSLGLAVQFSVGTLFKNKRDISLLLQQCVAFPNQFIRFCSDLHSAGIYYDSKSEKFHFYDSSSSVGNVPGSSELTLSFNEMVEHVDKYFRKNQSDFPLGIMVYAKGDPEQVLKWNEQYCDAKYTFYAICFSGRLSDSVSLLTPLSLPIRVCDIESIEQLLGNGVSINQLNTNGTTPLFEAVLNRLQYPSEAVNKTIWYLVKQGATADPQHIDMKNNYFPPFDYASYTDEERALMKQTLKEAKFYNTLLCRGLFRQIRDYQEVARQFLNRFITRPDYAKVDDFLGQVQQLSAKGAFPLAQSASGAVSASELTAFKENLIALQGMWNTMTKDRLPSMAHYQILFGGLADLENKTQNQILKECVAKMQGEMQAMSGPENVFNNVQACREAYLKEITISQMPKASLGSTM